LFEIFLTVGRIPRDIIIIIIIITIQMSSCKVPVILFRF